MTLVNASGER